MNANVDLKSAFGGRRVWGVGWAFETARFRGRVDLQARNMVRKRHVSCELILQHIGRVHFNDLRHFAYHIHFPNGASYKIRYDWVRKESDYLRLHPELAGLDCDFSVSPHHLICKIQGGATKTGNQRIFIAKPMISVMRRRLTRWEQCGMFV